AGGRDVVGGDRIAEEGQAVCAVDVFGRRHVHGHAVEVGRVLDVGGRLVPGIQVAVRRLDGIPALVTLEHVGVAVLEHVGADGVGDQVADLLVGRPDVLQEDVVAVGVLAHRFAGDVHVERAGD